MGSSGGSEGVAFFHILDSLADVHDQPALSLLVLNHDEVVPSEVSVSGVGPWNLSVTLLILGHSLSEWKSSSCLLGSVVVFLYSLELEIFVPVTNAGGDGVFGSSLQLLGCVLHI